MSDKKDRILEDWELFEVLCRLKDVAPGDAMAVAGHISARSIQRRDLEVELAQLKMALEQEKKFYNDMREDRDRAEVELAWATTELGELKSQKSGS